MKKLFLLVGLLSLPTFASVSANVTLTSDYVWRGLGQTAGNPAIQGGFDYASDGGFYAGIWASNVEPDLVVVNSTIIWVTQQKLKMVLVLM